MTVAELLAKIKDLPMDMLVVASTDAEDIEHSPVSEVKTGLCYVPETAWYGWIVDPAEEGVDKMSSVPCVVIKSI